MDAYCSCSKNQKGAYCSHPLQAEHVFAVLCGEESLILRGVRKIIFSIRTVGTYVAEEKRDTSKKGTMETVHEREHWRIMKGGHRMKFTKLVLILGALVAVVAVPLFADNVAKAKKGENHCFTCHTSARTLIQITREIAKAQKGKPITSTETKGEG